MSESRVFDVIAYLRFPLCIGIVLIHSYGNVTGPFDITDVSGIGVYTSVCNIFFQKFLQ